MEGSPFNRCVQCDNVITNPLCSLCLAERMFMVIGELDPELASTIKGSEMTGDTKCLFCGEGIGLCASCFSIDIYNFLSERKSSLAANFLSQFDFDLRKKISLEQKHLF